MLHQKLPGQRCRKKCCFNARNKLQYRYFMLRLRYRHASISHVCNETRRLPNDTIKQLTVSIETLVRKANSLNTHDYKRTMTFTPQLGKITIKTRASYPSSIREPDINFRKLVDKLEQAKITMKQEESENFKTKTRISSSSKNLHT